MKEGAEISSVVHIANAVMLAWLCIFLVANMTWTILLCVIAALLFLDVVSFATGVAAVAEVQYRPRMVSHAVTKPFKWAKERYENRASARRNQAVLA